jgi:hypothetical protein
MAAETRDPRIKIATEEDFNTFIGICDSDAGWNICYDKGEDLKVWDQKSESSSINTVKMYCVFPELEALTLYDVLHDPEYRSVWDENMIEGYLIEQLDATNDIGYYSAKAPLGCSNRDFVNERSWRVSPDHKEFVIINHSVTHPKNPEKKGFVRANSIRTGYLVRVREGGGCTLTYMTQTDPNGWIPTWLVNWATKTFAPKIVERLQKASASYPTWKAKHNPDQRGWRDF